MRAIFFSVLFGFAVVCAGTAQAAPPLVPAFAVSAERMVPVGFKCGLVNGKLVCGDKQGGGKKQSDDDDDDDQPKKSKDKAIAKTCGKKVNCEAGLVKLEKPNKYGACCEAREGLPAPKQQEAAKCKFPGEIDPPNCRCPPGTTFIGYKGCVPQLGWSCTGMTKEGGPFESKFNAVSASDADAHVRNDMKNRNRTIVGQVNCEPNP